VHFADDPTFGRTGLLIIGVASTRQLSRVNLVLPADQL